MDSGLLTMVEFNISDSKFSVHIPGHRVSKQ
jgi:hypothetical protein